MKRTQLPGITCFDRELTCWRWHSDRRCRGGVGAGLDPQFSDGLGLPGPVRRRLSLVPDPRETWDVGPVRVDLDPARLWFLRSASSLPPRRNSMLVGTRWGPRSNHLRGPRLECGDTRSSVEECAPAPAARKAPAGGVRRFVRRPGCFSARGAARRSSFAVAATTGGATAPGRAPRRRDERAAGGRSIGIGPRRSGSGATRDASGISEGGRPNNGRRKPWP